MARDERQALLERKRAEASWAGTVDDLERRIALAERRVAVAESAAEEAITAEANARRGAEVATAERDELAEDLLAVEKEADDAKWSLLLATKRETRAKVKLAAFDPHTAEEPQVGEVDVRCPTQDSEKTGLCRIYGLDCCSDKAHDPNLQQNKRV